MKYIGWFLLALALTGQGNTWAQFDSVIYNPDNTPIVEGFLALHDNGSGPRVFSAFGHKWHRIALSGSSVLGTGDWVALIRKVDGPIIGYSARYDAVSAAPCDPENVMYYLVGDDVALLIAMNYQTSRVEAHGYSGQKNEWVTQELDASALTADRLAISRFVIGVDDNGVMYGFSARTGRWRSFAYDWAGELPKLSADGNVLLMDWTRPGIPCYEHWVAAFSGVVGEWDALQIAPLNPPPTELDHNVAFTLKYIAPLVYPPAGYSAYNGKWVTFSTCSNEYGKAHLADNVVALEIPDGLLAIGSRPGKGWQFLHGGKFKRIGNDAVVACLEISVLYAFSGVAGGTWVSEPCTDAEGSFAFAPPHLAYVFDCAQVIHIFAPAYSAWSPTRTIPGPTFYMYDAVAPLDAGGPLEAYSTRWNEWQSGPTLGGTMVGRNGSLFAIQETTPGPTLGHTYIWDERRNQFRGPFTVGGASTLHTGVGPSTENRGRNLVLFEGASSIAAFGVQRGEFEPALDSHGFTPTLPLAEPPVVEENVAVFVAGSRLWAYGSAGEMHCWYGWPNGTEYPRWSDDSYVSNIPFSCRSEAAEDIYLVLDMERVFTPNYSASFAGPCWLPLPLTVFPPPKMGTAAGENFHVPPPSPPPDPSPPPALVLPPVSLPVGFQLWTQSLRFDPKHSPPLQLSMNPGACWIF